MPVTALRYECTNIEFSLYINIGSTEWDRGSELLPL